MSEHPSLPFHPYPSPSACISQTVKLLLCSPLHVLLQLRGKAVRGFAEPIFDQSLTEQKITQIVEMDSREAKYFSVVLDNRKRADPASVKLSAQHFILIRIRLLVA